MPAEESPHSRRVMLSAPQLLQLCPGFIQAYGQALLSIGPTRAYQFSLGGRITALPMGDKSYRRVFILPFFNMFKGSGPFF